MKFPLQMVMRVWYLQYIDEWKYLIHVIQGLYEAHIESKSKERLSLLDKCALYTEYLYKGMLGIITMNTSLIITFPFISYFILHEMECAITLFLPGIDPTTVSGYIITNIFHLTICFLGSLVFLACDFLIILLVLSPLIFAELIEMDINVMNDNLKDKTLMKFSKFRLQNIILMHKEVCEWVLISHRSNNPVIFYWFREKSHFQILDILIVSTDSFLYFSLAKLRLTTAAQSLVYMYVRNTYKSMYGFGNYHLIVGYDDNGSIFANICYGIHYVESDFHDLFTGKFCRNDGIQNASCQEFELNLFWFYFKHDHIYDAVLEIKWEQLPMELQLCYQFLVKRCQSPTLLSIGGFLPANLTTCVSVWFFFRIISVFIYDILFRNNI